MTGNFSRASPESADTAKPFKVRWAVVTAASTIMVALPVCYAALVDIQYARASAGSDPSSTRSVVIINGFVLMMVTASGRLILRALLVKYNNELLFQRTLLGSRAVRWAEVSDVQLSDTALIVCSASDAIRLSLVILEPSSVLGVARERLPQNFRDRLIRTRNPP